MKTDIKAIYCDYDNLPMDVTTLDPLVVRESGLCLLCIGTEEQINELLNEAAESEYPNFSQCGMYAEEADFERLSFVTMGELTGSLASFNFQSYFEDPKDLIKSIGAQFDSPYMMD